MKYFSGRISRCNLVCAALVLVLIVLQCVPFWHYGETSEETISINRYIWNPGKYPSLDASIQEQTNPDYHIDDIFWTPFLIMILGILGIILCIALANVPWVSMVAGVVGAIGTYGYIAKPAFHLGSLWQLHLVVSIALVAAAVITVCFGVKDRKTSSW